MTGHKARWGKWALRAGAALLAGTLLGCGGARKTAPDNGGHTPTPGPGVHRPAGIVMTQQQRLQADHNLRGTLPPQALAALQKLGLQQPSPAHSPKRASVALPYQPFDITQAYAAGDGGWIDKSADVTLTPAPPSMDMAPAGANYPASFSYIIYRIDDVVPEPLSLLLYSQNSTTPVGVCFYNWAYGAAGRWEPLFYGTPDVSGICECHLDKVAGADWTNAGGDLALAVFCLNPSTLSVTGFTLSDQTANDYPYALMESTPASGHATLSVTLDASASHDDDGSVVSYRFDPLGDGNWVDNGTDPTFDYSFDTIGAYHPVVEVTDDEGLTATWETTVIVSPAAYDEVETNDDGFSANTLPAIPFEQFFGNAGPTGSYDGSQEDWFEFSANTGDEVSFRVEFANDDDVAGNFSAWIVDSFGSTYEGSFFSYPAQTFSHIFDGTEVAPYYVRVQCASGHSDYIISSGNIAYEEHEDNDSPAGAQRLDNLADLPHQLTAFDGSLGNDPPDYEGYDGDLDDWFYFGTGAINSHVSMTLTNDSATGDIGISLIDFDGDVLASSATDSGAENIEYDFQPGDTEPYFFQVTGTGYSDYELNGSTNIVNPGYDETEPNESEGMANALPAIPFSGFTGNVGAGGDYDGGSFDYFSFSASVGDKLEFTVTPTQTAQQLLVGVTDFNGRPIGAVSVDGGTGVATAHALIRSNDTAPYILYVWYFDTDNDYTIDGAADNFFETENNDNNAQANDLGAGFFGFYSGSLGSGGSDYDGDSFDVFKFDADLGDDVQFTVFFDDGTGNMVTYLRDSNGDQLASGVDNGDGTINLTTTIGPGDTAPYYMELAPGIGYEDYWIARYPPGP